MAVAVAVAFTGLCLAAQDPPANQNQGAQGQTPPGKPGDSKSKSGTAAPPQKSDSKPSPQDKPGDKPAEKPPAKPGDKPSAKPADKPADKTSAKPSEKPGDKAKPDTRKVPLDVEAQKGMPRTAPPIFSITKKEQFVVPDPKEIRLFETIILHKGGDKAVATKVIQFRIYSLTDPLNLGKIGTLRDQILKDLNICRVQAPDIHEIYVSELLNAMPKLLTNHIFVRINAMLILARVKDERALPILVGTLRDAKQHEAVQYWAIKGVFFLGGGDPVDREHQEIKNKGYESEAVIALLDILKRNEPVHYMTRRAIVQTLGAVGRPMRNPVARDAEVAVALLMIMRDPAMDRFTRTEAAVALGRLRVPNDMEFNFQLVAHEIARFAADCVIGALAETSEEQLRAYLFLYDADHALTLIAGDPGANNAKLKTGSAAQNVPARTKGDHKYAAALRDMVHETTRDVMNVYKPTDPKLLPPAAQAAARLAKIRELLWKSTGVPKNTADLLATLKKNPPRDGLKVTPTTIPLPELPELKVPGAPKDKSEPVADEKKDSGGNASDGP